MVRYYAPWGVLVNGLVHEAELINLKHIIVK